MKPKKPNTLNTRQDQVFQVRYRNPRHMLEIFWAEDVLDFGTSFRFTGCRIMRIATIKGTGMFKNYHTKLGNITIPNSLVPTTIKDDKPEWWRRTREEAEAEIKRMAQDPIVPEIGHHLGPFSEDLCTWLHQLTPRRNRRRRSV